MFSGIVAALGRIETLAPLEKGKRLVIEAGTLGMDDVGIGDSIAVNGVCLTVVEKTARGFAADVSEESFRVTVGLDRPGEVNLEKALRLSDRLGGHLVTGHVDGVGEVVAFERIGESHRLVVRAPDSLAKYIARKGSITIQGVSLTVNAVEGPEFEVNLIPHTVQVTTLRHLSKGAPVNLEIDLVARYVERILGTSK